MRVRWEDFEPQGYEDMVAVLVSRLHPDSQRIDGRGGDGGRDVQIVDRDGQLLHAFELKSFTGRMNDDRRKQVKNSLETAAKLDPPEWTLVVPIDPTPGELKWFDDLRGDHDFPLTWRGKTWLDEKMSAHPDIRNYYIERAADEVVNLLRELREEEAKITDVPDAIERLKRLHGRLNEIDPHYRYELSTGGGARHRPQHGTVLSVTFDGARVDVYEKYVGALKDRPITGRFEIVVEPHDEALLKGIEGAFDYGLPVTIPESAMASMTIDAPAGLGGTLTGGELRLESATVTLEEPLTLALNVMEGDDLQASWPVRVTEKRGGGRGVILDGLDETGWLQFQLQVNPSAHEFHATFKLEPSPAVPATLVPLFRWMSACRPPRRLVIVWPDDSEMSSELETTLLDEGGLGVVEALAYLQERSGVYFAVSLELPREAQQVIMNRAALLQEGRSEFTWTSFSLSLGNLEPALEPLLNGLAVQFVQERDEWIELEEGRIPVGRIRTEIESARAVNPEALRSVLTAGFIADVKLVPGDSNKAQNRVVSQRVRLPST